MITVKKKLLPVLFIATTLLTVFTAYSISLNRDWQYFDEKIIFDEGIFPIPTTISEVFEVISLYAFKYHTESQNAFFSNIINIRSNPIGAALYVIALFLFKKNFFLYHLLSLVIHLTSTALVWLIFYKLFSTLTPEPRAQSSELEKEKSLLSPLPPKDGPAWAGTSHLFIFPTLLTLIWALHPVNTEAVLLGTNWSSLLNYLVCFALFYYYLNKVLKNEQQFSVKELITVSILFFLATLVSEYINILPVILFFTVFAFKRSLLASFKLCIPLFIGSFLYLIYFFTRYFLLKPSDILIFSPVKFSFERIFWLSPQIFIHFLKLFFYPKELTPYQTNHVYLANSLFDPYSIFCSVVFLLFLIIPITLFIIFSFGRTHRPAPTKSFNSPIPQFTNLLICYSFLASLFPYLHIISPTYCLISDRYCYFPLFTFLFLISSLILQVISKAKLKTTCTIVLFIVLILCTSRTYTRINDWQNSYTLFSSTIKSFKDNLHRGFAEQVLGYYFDSTGNKEKMKGYMEHSIKNLTLAINELEKQRTEIRNVPQTLIEYGLDNDSLILTSAFVIAYTRLNNFKENPKEILEFYEPYIKNKLTFAGFSQVDLYAKLLIQNNKFKKAQEVLETAIKKYPFSPTIIYTLSNFYLYKLKDYTKAENLIKNSFYYYPSYRRILLRLIKLSEIKNDIKSLADYQYLIGLRIHSIKAYQRALQLYLQQKSLNKANRTILKLINLDKENPTTFLLVSKYFQLKGQNNGVITSLADAYKFANKYPEKTDIEIYKSILLSLISFNAIQNNYPEAKKYISELELINTILTINEKEFIEDVKKKTI